MDGKVGYVFGRYVSGETLPGPSCVGADGDLLSADIEEVRLWRAENNIANIEQRCRLKLKLSRLFPMASVIKAPKDPFAPDAGIEREGREWRLFERQDRPWG